MSLIVIILYLEMIMVFGVVVCFWGVQGVIIVKMEVGIVLLRIIIMIIVVL